jgi:cytoskeletal protein RodZ
MAILGLLLLLAAAGLTLDVVFQNTTSINVDAVGQTFTLSTGWLFVAAVITGAVGLLGVTMLVGGMARARRRRVALADSRGTSQNLQTDRDRLAAELDRERAGRTSAPSQQRIAAAQENGPATVDLANKDRQADSALTEDTEDTAQDDADRHEPVAAGRHGIFHRRDH